MMLLSPPAHFGRVGLNEVDFGLPEWLDSRFNRLDEKDFTIKEKSAIMNFKIFVNKNQSISH